MSPRTLIVRVWFEGNPPSDLRARLVEVAESHSADHVIATVANVADLTAALASWIEGLTVR
jgi:hypothetical protein